MAQTKRYLVRGKYGFCKAILSKRDAKHVRAYVREAVSDSLESAKDYILNVFKEQPPELVEELKSIFDELIGVDPIKDLVQVTITYDINSNDQPFYDAMISPVC